MRILKHLIVLFLLSISFVACNDEGPDGEGPIIEIINIPDNKEYKFGDDLIMNLKFTDRFGVYEYQYQIYAKEYNPKEFTLSKPIYINFEGYYNERTETQIIYLPAKSLSETYYEGDYVIEVKASDINQNVSTYYKPIKIVYPTE